MFYPVIGVSCLNSAFATVYALTGSEKTEYRTRSPLSARGVVNERGRRRFRPPARELVPLQKQLLWFHRPVMDANIIDQAEEETRYLQLPQ